MYLSVRRCVITSYSKTPPLHTLPSYQHRSIHFARQRLGSRRNFVLGGGRKCAVKYSLQQRKKRQRHCQAFSDANAIQDSQQQQQRNPFQGYSQQPDALQNFLGNTPKTALIAAAVVSIGGAGFLGNLIGSQAPVAQRLAARLLGAAVGAAAAVYGVKILKEKRESAAVLALYQTLARAQDLSALTAQDIASVGAKFDVNLAQSRAAEVKSAYDTFVESVIPVTAPLTGEEAGKIASFKDALGLAAEDAASAHIDVGRRFLRLANEAGSRAERAEYRKALNKLIYVSGLVFGEKQEAFLLPWKRVCDYNDATMYVAKRDQAKALFKAHLESRGSELPADKGILAEIRRFQQKIKVEDSIAEETIRESTRSHVEACLERAIDCLKRRTRVRDYSDLVKEVQAVVDYSRDLEALAGDSELPPGLGKVTIYGGKLEAENKSRELRDLFRTYLEEQLRLEKEMSDDLEDDLAELQLILGLGKREAADITSEITSKVYKQLLREEVTSGRLDAASSKAEVLAGLCDRLNFDPDAASALHKQLYKQKLDSLLENGKRITDEDAAELDRQRRLLCIKKADVRQIHRDTCGKIYSAAVEDALNAGHERFTGRDRASVMDAMRNARLDPEMAKDILDTTVRKAFMGFINRSRNQRNRLEAAKELKALVFFSNIVVTPLLEDLNGLMKRAEEDTQEKAKKELAELMIKAKQEAEKEEEAAAAVALKPDKEAESATQSSPETEAASPETSETVEAIKEGEAGAEIPAESMQSKKESPDATAGSPQAEGSSEAADSEASTTTTADKPSQDTPAELSKVEQPVAAEAKTEAEEDSNLPETLKKSQAGREKEEATSSGKPAQSQSEITLKDDLDQRDRLDIYRNFLLYCMSGNVVSLPMGTSVQIQRDQSEFTRLSQLGDILGLTRMDVLSVHTGLSEQAFRQQVQQMTAGGNLTAERVAELEDMREKFGLSKESAQKIIKGAQNQHLISNMNAAKASGNLTLQQLLDMRDQGIQISEVTSDELRATLYNKEVVDMLTSGTGNFDRERFLDFLPKELGLKERKVNSILEALAKERKKATLVQGISHLRQKNLDEAVKSLNNLLCCYRALPSDKGETWQPREELQDMWSVYIGKETSREKQAEVAKILGISDSEAESLRSLVESGNFKLAEEAAEEDIF